MSVPEKAAKLRELIRQISEAGETIIREWEAEDKRCSTGLEPSDLPSEDFYDARRVMQAACGTCVDLVQDPFNLLANVAYIGVLSRSLYMAVQARIADVLDEGDQVNGVAVEEISHRIGIASQKLTQILRCLCSSHIFLEVRTSYFANNETSRKLVGNEPLRCYLLLSGLDEMFASIGKMPAVLFDPEKSASVSPRESAFQEANQTALTMWEWYEQGNQNPDGSWKYRPDLETWSVGMMGIGQSVAPSLCAGYPWDSLGSATIVDVGGGIGSMSLELAKSFPNLRFVVQDREAVMGHARQVWNSEIPGAIATGRTKLVVHNFFKEQPNKDADVYLMRYVMHDWPDDDCVKILKRLKDAMKPNARILVADMIIHTTVGSPLLKNAPAPLPANYGQAHLFRNLQDLGMLMLFNGMERTPEQFSILATRAGLRIAKIWECRSHMCITEMVKDPGRLSL